MSTNRCDPEFWLGLNGGPPVWDELERRARHQSDYHAAALLALRSLLETHREAGLDLFDRVERLERWHDKGLKAERLGEEHW